MSKRGDPREALWSEFEKARLRRYIDRSFTTKETAKCLDRTAKAVERMAQRLGLRFHGPTGAPPLNKNRHHHELDKRLQRLFQEDRA